MMFELAERPHKNNIDLILLVHDRLFVPAFISYCCLQTSTKYAIHIKNHARITYFMIELDAQCKFN